MTNEEIHEYRKQLNILQNTFGNVITVDSFVPQSYDRNRKAVGQPHEQIKFAMKKLKYATYWLGKIFSYRGQPAPTEKDYNDRGIDDATTDSNPLDTNPLVNLSSLRADIQEIIDLVDIVEDGYKPTKNETRAITCIFNYLTEARFAIGELIGELRNDEIEDVEPTDSIVEETDTVITADSIVETTTQPELSKETEEVPLVTEGDKDKEEEIVEDVAPEKTEEIKTEDKVETNDTDQQGESKTDA